MKKPYNDYYNHTEENYINSQRYMECQLVTAINAAICMDEPPVRQNTPEYERLVDLVHARHGSAISVENAWTHLRLEAFYDDFSWDNVVKYLKRSVINRRNPIEFEVRSRRTGGHSILAIDCDEKKKRIRVTNFEEIAKSGWLSWERLLKHVRANMFKGQLPGKFRVFRLNPWYIRDLQTRANMDILNRPGAKNAWPSPYENKKPIKTIKLSPKKK